MMPSMEVYMKSVLKKNSNKKVDTRKNIRVVTKNSLITAKSLGSLSLNTRKFFLLAIAQCRISDKEFFAYEMSLEEFSQILNISKKSAYNYANSISDELLKIVVVDELPNKEFRKYSAFSYVEYKDGIISFKLNSDMTEFLLNLNKNFSKPLLADFMPMQSTFTMSVWHLMQREMQSSKPDPRHPAMHFNLSLEELRIVTNTENKLERISQFKERVLNTSIKEIKTLQLADITYTDVKRGRSVVSFDFIVKFVGPDYYTAFKNQPDTPRKDYVTKKTRLLTLKRKVDAGIPLTDEEVVEKKALELAVGKKMLCDFPQ